MTMTTADVVATKERLQRLVRTIVDEDEYTVETTEEAIRILCALKELKSRRPLSAKLGALVVPQEFRCPISKELMRDPVVLASGQTYDRPFILRWLNEGNRTCPQTQHVLPHTNLTPNHLVHDMISQWCKDNGIETPKPVGDIDEDVTTDADRDRLNLLLCKLSSSVSEQKAAAKELRSLTKRAPSFRTLFAETSIVPRLLNPLSSGIAGSPPDLQEDLITTVLNLSIYEDNKKIFAESPLVVQLLIESLLTGTIQTKSNAAAAIFSLSAIDSNKLIFVEHGALKHLVKLLDEGHHLAVKDVASALFCLCRVQKNRGRAVSEGAVEVILKKLVERVLVDELLAILALLSSHHLAMEEMVGLGALSCLLAIVRESTSECTKENCVAVIYSLCYNNRTQLKEIMDEERVNGTLSAVAQSGTSRAKRKANKLLDRMNKAGSLTHTA